MARAPTCRRSCGRATRLAVGAVAGGALCGLARGFAAPQAPRALLRQSVAAAPAIESAGAEDGSLDSVVAVAARGAGTSSSTSCLITAACACVAAGARSAVVRRRRRQQNATARRAANSIPGAGGDIETFLVRGPVDPSKLAVKCASLAAYFDLECVAFFCLGVDPEVVASVAGGSLGLHGVCPVYIASAQGIIGWDKELKANVEIMEGEDGASEGVVVVAFRGGCHEPSSQGEGEDGSLSTLPEGRALHMVVRSSGKPATPPSGVIYGGIAKSCYVLEHSGNLQEVSQFAVSTPFAVLASFDKDAGKAASTSLSMLPEVASPPIAAGYFSCPERGARKYGEENVETSEFAKSGLESVRLFGMFADAFGPPTEAGPIACVPELTEWTSILDADPRPEVLVHSADSASILALYGK